MDTVLTLLISAGIIAFGLWVIAATITVGWPWTLMGLVAVIVGLLSLYESFEEAKTRRFEGAQCRRAAPPLVRHGRGV
jgi:hypothetical protein